MDIFADINEASTGSVSWCCCRSICFSLLLVVQVRAIGGTAYPIGLCAFASTGAVVGLAAFGTKKSVARIIYFLTADYVRS